MNFLDGLRDSAARMGRPRRARSVDTELTPPGELAFGEGFVSDVALDLDELEEAGDLGGLLGYRGSQVLLYLREQGARAARIRANPASGPRYHLAHCSALAAMRARDRYGRYVVTNDLSGLFRLVASEKSGARDVRAGLHVCRKCLHVLGYRGYRSHLATREAVFEQFALPTFASTYSTLFRHRPNGRAGMMRPAALHHPACESASGDAALDCDGCGAGFSVDSHLLTVLPGALGASARVLCVDCRRKPPVSDPLHVREDDMRDILRARHGSGWCVDDWETAYRLADSAFHALMTLCERRAHAVPEPGVALAENDGTVRVEPGLAWPASRQAVMLHGQGVARARARGWNAITLERALHGQLDGGR